MIRMNRQAGLTLLLLSIICSTVLVTLACVINYENLFGSGDLRIIVLLIWISMLADTLQIVVSIRELLKSDRTSS
jgi:hypothetical protein